MNTYFLFQIKLKATSPIQTDGEPWLEYPCEIVISPHSTIPMLKCVGC